MATTGGVESALIYCPQCGECGIGVSAPRCACCERTTRVDGRVLVIDDAPTDDYSPESATAQADVAAEHVWFQLRTETVLDVTGPWLRLGARRFVDFGCGNGYIMRALEHQGWETVGVDMHIEGLRRAERSTRGQLLCSRIPNVRLTQPADGAGLFDVIEHVVDDVMLLRHARAQLAPGGFIVVTVPAMAALWSDFDVLLGHKRRYSRRMLRDRLQRAGFICQDVRYCFPFAVPGLWVQRRRLARHRSSRRAYYETPSPAVTRVALALGRVERTLARHSIRPPFGSSLIAVGRRDETHDEA